MEKRKYFQPEAETMPRDEIKKLQSEKLVKQVKHVYENLPYYRELMDKKGEYFRLFSTQAKRYVESANREPKE